MVVTVEVRPPKEGILALVISHCIRITGKFYIGSFHVWSNTTYCFLSSQFQMTKYLYIMKVLHMKKEQNT